MAESSRVIQQKEKYYKRNYITLMFEAFFVNFAFSIFSYTTVFPVYVTYISDNSIFVSLIAVLYFGCSYGSSIFSCILGVNAKSPKWISIIICGLQRVGFILIIFSTYFVLGKKAFALAVFFLSFGLFATSAGMASPVFSNMIGSVIHRNIGGFFGSYSLVGAASGVLSARIMKKVLEQYDFPVNYRTIFIMGTVMAIIASFILAVGLKEVQDEQPREKVRFAHLPAIIQGIFKENEKYRRFVLLRMILGAAEMTLPFYIIRVSAMEGVTTGFVGTMTTILLVSNMIAGKVMGYIGDRKGPLYMVRVGAFCGVLAAACALFMPGYYFSFVLFVLVSFAQQGVSLSTSVAGIVYSERGKTPILVAAMGFIIAPCYIVCSMAGGVLADIYSINIVFVIGLLVYAVTAYLAVLFERKN